MPSGLIALLDDVAMIARLAAASVDDIAAAGARAGVKAAGVVIDDAAVTPRYVTGLSPDRELPIIFKIMLGSLRNKLLILLPAALLLSQFAPFLMTPILMLGGSYLAFEATEKIVEKILGDHHDEETLAEADTPGELEARQVKGAIRTDFILSAEIMAIALSTLAADTLATQAAALVLVAVAITLGVYGTVALIVKLDDIGLHICARASGLAAAFGRGLVRVVPLILTALSAIGVAAMLWVGGGILVHGLDELGLTHLPDAIHDLAAAAGSWLGDGTGSWLGDGTVAGITEWIASALAAAVVGLMVGGIITLIVRRFVAHPAKRAVDG